MSIFTQKFSLHSVWSVSFFMAVACCVFLFFPITSYASEVPVSEEKELVISKEIYHKHVGSPEECGGCYTVKKERVEGPCAGLVEYDAERNISICNICGQIYPGDKSGNKCGTLRPGDKIVIYYDLGCGMTEQSCVGILLVYKSTNEWTKSLLLTASYEARDGLCVLEPAHIWNEGAASASNTYEVTENGRYSYRLHTDEYVDSESARIEVNIQNIDVTGPRLEAYAQGPSGDWIKENVVVTLEHIKDRQPGGGEGCGIHSTPYSFDNGHSWTDNPVKAYSENGTYAILLQDKLGNVSSRNIVISNIDTTPPKARVEYDTSANLPSVDLSVYAKDLQPDESGGAGLHEQAYSFDNGKTWTNQSMLHITQNTTVKIAVRDQLGNIAYLEEKITNIDATGPKVSYIMNVTSWTNENVKISLSAVDVNTDGSKGSGLPDKWYSVDGGKTWTNTPIQIVKENQIIHILARDNNNNQSKIVVNVNQIDKVAPEISLTSAPITDNGEEKVRLTVNAHDKKSGLANNAYSWNNGTVFSNCISQDVTENGTYTVAAMDKAGNVSKISITVDTFVKGIENEVEAETEIELEVPVVEIEMQESQRPKKVQVGKMREEKTQTVEMQTEEAQVEEAVVVMEERVQEPEPIQEETLKRDKKEVIIVSIKISMLFVGLLGLFFLIWFIKCRTVTVFMYDNKKEKVFAGWKWICQREEHYVVEISEKMMEHCMTNRFCFCLDSFFVSRHQEEEISFLFPGKICITREINEKLDIALI